MSEEEAAKLAAVSTAIRVPEGPLWVCAVERWRLRNLLPPAVIEAGKRCNIICEPMTGSGQNRS